MMVLKASMVNSKDEGSIAHLVMEEHAEVGWVEALEVSAKWWGAYHPTAMANGMWISQQSFFLVIVMNY